MRFPALRSISGRIVLGFALLTAAFGGVSLYTIVNMHRLALEIRVIRTGYVPLALQAKDLAEKQNDLRLYLDDIPTEATAQRVEPRLRGYRYNRGNAMRGAETIGDDLTDVPRRHARVVAELHDRLRVIRAAVERHEALYPALLEAPPVEGSSADPAALARAEAALVRLRSQETRLYNQMWRFAVDQEELVKATARDLEESEAKLRKLAIYLGAIAVVLGFLVSAWATLTLRPLRKLREAARHIARGDYASRLDERGPTEVSGLAREFNVMGRAVEERERDLVRSERLAAVGKMAAMITHEVRNPLSSIGLNTELLEDELEALPGPSGEEARELCRSIHTEVDRLTAITEEYLHFTRLPKPKLAPEAINTVIGNLLDFEQEQLSQRGVTLELALEPELPAIRLDEAQIRQALLNLVRNAAEAVEARGGGCVAISSRRRDDDVAVVVEDDGPGIDDEAMAKIFDPFFSTKQGGTGLGLALTHQIIREHEGSIDVDRSPRGGARFTVRLPIGSTRAQTA